MGSWDDYGQVRQLLFGVIKTVYHDAAPLTVEAKRIPALAEGEEPQDATRMALLAQDLETKIAALKAEAETTNTKEEQAKMAAVEATPGTVVSVKPAAAAAPPDKKPNCFFFLRGNCM